MSSAPRAARLARPPAPARSRRAPWVAPAIIVGVQVLLVLLVSPRRDYPVEDDWAYAQIVQSILQGHFQLSDYLAPTLLVHVYWGALWCLLFGFSFTVLSVANLVMGGLAGLAAYGLLRELDFAPWPALAGALALLLNPITIFVDYTFQSDLTFLALLLAALWAFVAAGRRPRPLRYMLLGGLIGAGAVLTRQVGFAVPLAAALVWGARLGLRRGAAGIVAAVLPGVLGYGLFLAWVHANGGEPWAMQQYSAGATLAYISSSRFLAGIGLRLLFVVGFVAFLLIPLLAALLWPARDGAAGPGTAADGRGRPQRLRPTDALYLGLGGVLAGIYYAFYMAIGGSFVVSADVLTTQGYLPSLTGSETKLPVFPPGVWTALTALVAVLAAVLLVVMWRAPGRGAQARPAPGGAGRAIVGLASLGLAAVTFSSSIYHDSLLLPLLPGFIVLLLSQRGDRRIAPAPVLALLALLTAFSLVSLREFQDWHDASWRAGQALLRAGVPATRISGGIEWNYWALWQEAIRQAHAQGWPIGFGVHERLITPDYVISFDPHSTTPWVVDPRAPPQPRAYHVCAATPYARPLQPAPGYVYTLASGPCPPGIAYR